jgi:hypothetical protein
MASADLRGGELACYEQIPPRRRRMSTVRIENQAIV